MTEYEDAVPQIPRDRYGRPLVVPRGGGKPVAYTRCTTYIGCLEDTYNLSLWQQRMVALGLSRRQDLLLSVAAHPDDKTHLNKICEDAKEAAQAHAAATTGTALHALTERIDRGQDVGVVPDAYLADLAAYTEATGDLKATHIEQFCVFDRFKIGGTPDRVVKYGGRRYIADIKTGSIEYGIGKIAMQLAVYARSSTYDIATGERGRHDAEVDKGIIIHLPAGTGECTLHWVDLLEGWRGVLMAKEVRKWRSHKFRDLTEPLTPATGPTLTDLIHACPTADAVRALWAEHQAAWTEADTKTAQRHIETLAAGDDNAA